MASDTTPTTDLSPQPDKAAPGTGVGDPTASTLPPEAQPPVLSPPKPSDHNTLPEPTERFESGVGAGNLVPGYELAGELGRGGMGVVFRARQVTLNRTVALKMTLGERVGEKELIRFLAEAEAVALVNHRNVVQVYDYGDCSGRMYMALEYCPGGTLADRLKSQSIDSRSAAELLQKIAAGVSAAHEQGIVHRDLKPGNILFDRAGEPKVADFGLAKRATSDITQTGAIMGTPAYMAPEQAGGRTKFVGPAADVWALGVILYQCLTGHRPFQGDSTDALLNRILLDDPSPLRELNASVPRDLEAICLRCLEKDLSRRYPTALELGEDIKRYLDGEPVSASHSGLVTRLTSSLDRVQLHEQIVEYSTLLFVLAFVMLIPELWLMLVWWNDWSVYLVLLGHMARGAAFLAAVGYCRQWCFWPRGQVERQLWAVWGGYVVVCWAFGVSTRVAQGVLAVRLEFDLYQGWTALAALAFFTMAPTIWGYCTLVGLAYLGLCFIMAIDLRYAPIEFGLMWAIVLVGFGIRARRMGREALPLSCNEKH